MNQAKKVQKKPPVNRFHTPNRSCSLNAQGSPSTALTEPIGAPDTGNPIKIINQEGLRQSGNNLVAKENFSKGIGYSSVESSGVVAQKVLILFIAG